MRNSNSQIEIFSGFTSLEDPQKLKHTKSPFRYPGGKYYGLKVLKPFWTPVEHDEFREPFFGGGSVFFAKDKVKFNWVNDILKDLIVTMKVMGNPKKRESLIARLSKETASKERHTEMKSFIPKNELDIAYKYCYLNRTSYSGIMHKPAWGFADGKSSPPERWGLMIDPAGQKLEGVKITCLDFEEVIDAPAKGKKVLMFLDPPYFEADQKRAYEHHFLESDHKRLCKMLKKTKFKFILSYDNCKPVKELYSWANLQERSWQYNTANTNGSRFLGEELVITNF